MTRVSIDVAAVPSQPVGAGKYVIELVRALEGIAGGSRPELTVVARRTDGARWRSLAPSADVMAVVPGQRPLRLAWEQLSLARLLAGNPAGRPSSRPAGPAIPSSRPFGRPGRGRASGLVEVHHGPHYTMPARCPVPCVVTIHDMTFFDHPEWHERSKVPVFRAAMRLAARRATAIVCVSEMTAARLGELLRPSCPVHVVPHGVDSGRFSPVGSSGDGDRAHPFDAELLDRLGVRQPYILHLGTIEPRKNLPDLVAAFDRVAEAAPELSLVVAGTIGWGHGPFEASVSAARHRKRIVRLGYVDDQDVPALLRRAGVVAYPSLEEGFGLPALEALACGAPLVTTAGTVMDEMAGGAALSVPPDDAGKLAEALEAALEGGAEVTARRALGLQVAAKLTWERSAREHARIYAEAAGR
jgi:glycosyltransferase involved in cell wall biosynthesis